MWGLEIVQIMTYLLFIINFIIFKCFEALLAYVFNSSCTETWVEREGEDMKQMAWETNQGKLCWGL